MDELIAYITEKAKAYWNETADATEQIESFPSSIVDFVVESCIARCNFPDSFTESNKVSDLNRFKNTIAMSCVDVYAKAGAEGEKSHSENGVSRTYDSTWISESLLTRLPNYVKIIY